MSGKHHRRRNAVALTVSAVLHVTFLAFVINESATPYALPEIAPPPIEAEIVTPEEVPPPPPPPVIPPKIKQALEKQSQQPPPPPLQPPTPTPPKPQVQPPTPVAPPKVSPPKPNPPTPAPPTQVAPTPAKPTPPKPNPVPAAPAPARTPAPPSPSPSPSPAVKPSAPAPTATVAPPNPISARITAPVIVLRPSLLNLHKPAKEAPANVPTLPLSPAVHRRRRSPLAGGGAPAAAPGALSGSRLNGLSPYPYGTLPSGGPGLRGTLVGCANADAVNLSGVERARCNARFGEEAARAPVLDGIDPAKRAQFDKAADRQENDRKAGMPVGTDRNGAQGWAASGPN